MLKWICFCCSWIFTKGSQRNAQISNHFFFSLLWRINYARTETGTGAGAGEKSVNVCVLVCVSEIARDFRDSSAR